jgi:ABC-type bacteriocin/lantibiotic exporter with double-glycine peptidase domain
MTGVIVAHRLSTVRHSDVIYVVGEGSVVEHGSHDNLVASDAGAYSDESQVVSGSYNQENSALLLSYAH